MLHDCLRLKFPVVLDILLLRSADKKVLFQPEQLYFYYLEIQT